MSEFLEQAAAAYKDSQDWFPGQQDDIGFLTLALAGEVGELANIVKKIERGSLRMDDPQVRHEMTMEMTDVYIYLLNLAAVLKVDLSEVYHVKRAVNVRRFGRMDNG